VTFDPDAGPAHFRRTKRLVQMVLRTLKNTNIRQRRQCGGVGLTLGREIVLGHQRQARKQVTTTFSPPNLRIWLEAIGPNILSHWAHQLVLLQLVGREHSLNNPNLQFLPLFDESRQQPWCSISSTVMIALLF
jgi:hypothetical protein